MQYKVGKSLTGKLTVQYGCPRCKAKLVSKLSKAGKTDICPECNTSFSTPGTKEVAEIERNKAFKKAALKKEEIRNRQIVEEVSREGDERERQSSREEQAALQRAKQDQGKEFDVARHNWDMGCPYVYHSVELGTVAEDWTSTFDEITNMKAAKGWEYYRAESLTAQRPNGCLAGLLGNPYTNFNVVLLVFRKPAEILAKKANDNFL